MRLKRRGDPGAAMPAKFHIPVHFSFLVHQRRVMTLPTRVLGNSHRNSTLRGQDH